MRSPCKSYIFRMLATRRPSEAPQRRDGTNRPLGTDTPYVQQLRIKYNTKNSERVTGLKVAANQTQREEKNSIKHREKNKNCIKHCRIQSKGLYG